MGYVSKEAAQAMSHEDLVEKFIETQTIAAAAISEALTVGGNKSEKAIEARYDARIASELRRVICIRRKFHGGSEDQSFDAWVDETIQDHEAAINVATDMVSEYPEPHEWNADQPDYYETFEILDLEEFRRALETIQLEYA